MSSKKILESLSQQWCAGWAGGKRLKRENKGISGRNKNDLKPREPDEPESLIVAVSRSRHFFRTLLPPVKEELLAFISRVKENSISVPGTE